MYQKSKEEDETISLPDGRHLGYLMVGEGKPVLWFHGFPSSRLEVSFFKSIANTKQLQIIGVDRPGFGLSTFAPKRRFRDFAADINYLVDYLGIDKFTIVGYSEGGHYAITCTALLSDRIARTMVISGLSLPPDTSGMNLMNKISMKLVSIPVIRTWLIKKMRNMILEIAKNPDELTKHKAGREFLKNLSDDDAKFWIDTSFSKMRVMFIRCMVEAFRQGSDSVKAMIQESNLLKKGWDVDLLQIPSGLVHIWHGTADKQVPISNAFKNSEVIPGARLEIFNDEGHMFFLNELERMFEIVNS